MAENQLDRQWIRDIKNTLSVQATIEPAKLGAWDLMEQMVRNDDTDLTEERVVEKFLRCMPKKYA